ncbi:MAG: site-2 protease family protein [Candidatus Cloacimonadaceae bacterium]
MTQQVFSFLFNAAVIAAIFYSIIIHEMSHGIAAFWLGDDTAKRMGRISLNPMRHIDWFGTVIMPLILYFTAGFVFGYAKPVPINPYNFKNFKRDTGISAAAGPLSNILIAILFAILYHISGSNSILYYLSIPIIQINLFLALLNLIPIPPLDGSKVLGIFLSDEAYFRYTAQERYGMIFLFGLILISNMFHLNIFGRFIFPIITFAMKLLGIS